MLNINKNNVFIVYLQILNIHHIYKIYITIDYFSCLLSLDNLPLQYQNNNY